MSSACAPCVFGASSEILSLRNSIITVPVSTSTITVTGLNGSLSTRYETFTLSGTPLPSGVQYVTDTTDITTRTLGTTLTFGTTYVHYLGFYGAAITSSAETCAESLQPTPLTTSNANPASFVFVYQGTTGLPPKLLSYLDDSAGFIAQLNGDDLGECSIIHAPTPLSGAPATVTASTTSILTSLIASTLTTAVSGGSLSLVTPTPVPSSLPFSSLPFSSLPFSSLPFSSLPFSAILSRSSEATSEATSETAVAATTAVETTLTSVQAVSASSQFISYSPVVLLQPVSVRALPITATSIPEPQAETLADSSSSSSTTSLPISESSLESASSSTLPESSVDLGELFSVITGASLTSAEAASSTSATKRTSSSQADEHYTTIGTLTLSLNSNLTSATSTSSIVYYTGGASRPLSRVQGMGTIQWLLGLTLPFLL